MLADFSRSAGVAARQLGELLARLGEPPPSGSPRGEVVARFRAWLTGLGGDTAIARAGLAAEQKDEQMLASLVEKLARAGADPEALQRLTEARASSRHRIELFREVLGVPKPSA
jgi:hypothetical protein